jgi:soluble lytic murein transglycosylase-like protein
VRRLLAAVAGLALLGAAGCGSSSSPWAGAPPADAGELAAKLSAADSAWRQAAASWTRNGIRGGEPPAKLTQPGQFVQRAVDLLSQRPGLAVATIQRLPDPIAGEIKRLTGSLRDLHRLSAGWGGPGGGVDLAMPAPLDDLVHSYREAERRFGVDWHTLAAINFVESSFGRARSASVAGARGPMQFIPATWRAYGLGGNVYDPHDAVLGAANYLHASGAPADYGRALFSYNRSRLYVDAVLRYARLIAADRATLFLLYSWPTP